MKYAVLLTLDDTTTAIADGIASRIAAVHPSPPADSEIRPHITLGICEEMDIAHCEAVLMDLASTPPIACRFDSLGAFISDPAVVFAAPVVTTGLLDLHARFHDRFEPIASGQIVFYLPGRWVPHCTLADGLPLAVLPEAIRIACGIGLPLLATITAIQIVDVRPPGSCGRFPSRWIEHLPKRLQCTMPIPAQPPRSGRIVAPGSPAKAVTRKVPHRLSSRGTVHRFAQDKLRDESLPCKRHRSEVEWGPPGESAKHCSRSDNRREAPSFVSEANGRPLQSARTGGVEKVPEDRFAIAVDQLPGNVNGGQGFRLS